MSEGELPDWAVYALCYGYTRDLPASRSAIGGASSRAHDIAYYVWVITNAERCIVVDTGYNVRSGQRRGHELAAAPADLIRSIGFRADLVDTVVLTHLHYDHAGNLDGYPNAVFHVQAAELSFATGPDMRHAFFRSMYEAADIQQAIGLLYTERLEVHEGDWDVAAGISAHLSPGHTPGIQFVRVHTRAGWLVLASDTCHYTFLREQDEVYPVVWSPAALLAGYVRLDDLASSPDLIVPGHDPDVLARFPAARPELRDRIVRLD